MTNLIVSFCNVFPPGLALGVYNFGADKFRWIDLSPVGRNWVGINGICCRLDGYWILPQVAYGGISSLAFVNRNLHLECSYRLAQAGDAHSLIAYKDGFLITDTQHDRLIFARIVEGGRELVEAEYWRYSTAETGLDTIHLNGVAELDGDVYVSLFGPKPPEGWLMATGGQIINVTRDKIICEGLNHPHSPVNVDGTLYWLESRLGLVHSFSKASGHRIVLSLRGYLRGLTYDNEYLYIGASARRRRSRSTGVNIPPSEELDDLHSWIYRIRRDNLQCIERRSLTRWGAEIYDLAPVSANSLSFPDTDSQAVVQRFWRFEDEFLRLRDERDALDAVLRSSLRQLLEKGHYEQALPILESLCEKQAANSEWNYHLAYCVHMLNQDAQRALRHYELALAQGYDEFWVRYNRGALYWDMKELEAARDELERATALQPEHTGARQLLDAIWNALVRREIELRNFEKALRWLAALRARQPMHPWWNYLTGFALHLQGQELEIALQHYTLALEYLPPNDPEEFWVRYNRGQLLSQIGRLSDALEELERACILEPSHEGAQAALARVRGLRDGSMTTLRERIRQSIFNLPGLRGILHRLNRLEIQVADLSAQIEMISREQAERVRHDQQSEAPETLEAFLARHNPLGFDFPIFLDYPVYPKQRYTTDRPHVLLYELFDSQRATYVSWIREMAMWRKYLSAIPMQVDAGSTEPAWNNGWFPGLDSLTLYTLLTTIKPKRYLEVGSGNSTKFARRAIRDHHLQTQIVSIDPHPRVDVERICDQTVREPLENLQPSIFSELEAGDILFIDSSHRIFQNSDVTIVLLDILPYLRPGVLIHFHDIYLPYDYPDHWKRRYYSEQYGVAVLLLADKGRRYEILMANTFISRDAALQSLLTETILNYPGLGGIEPYGGSLWLRVRSIQSC